MLKKTGTKETIPKDNIVTRNINQLIKILGITGRELARRTGLPYSTVGRMTSEISNDHRVSNIIPICQNLQVSADELLGLTSLSPRFFSKDAHILNDFSAYLPLITQDEASEWKHNIDDIFPDKWKNWCKADFKTSKTAFAILITDQKHTPIAPENSVIIVDPVFELKENIYVLINTKGYSGMSVRKVLIEEPNIYLQPLNTQLPPNIISKDQTITGKIVQVKVNYDN